MRARRPDYARWLALLVVGAFAMLAAFAILTALFDTTR
jgi:hypothetical protein